MQHKNIDNQKIHWSVICVNEYAKYKELTPKAAFNYLYKHGGIDFLKEHYEAEHQLSFDDVVEDLEIICQRNEG